MKKHLKLITVCLCLVALFLCITACESDKNENIILSGSYVGESNGIPCTYSFDGNKCTQSGEGWANEYTYTISGNEITLCGTSELISGMEITVAFKQGNDYIEIDGVKYTKKN